MVSSKADTDDLSELSEGALCELGPLLAVAQSALKQELHAQRVYIGRYGHSPGYPIHFHVIPIFDWVEALFWKNERYRLLGTFAEGPGKPRQMALNSRCLYGESFASVRSRPRSRGERSLRPLHCCER